ncbi:MAG: hypothetical protein AAGH57_10365 [Pseudomonadota bacterium]
MAALLKQAFLLGVFALAQGDPLVDEVSNPLSALDALRLCQNVTSDFGAARAYLESEGWEHRPPSDYIAKHWGAPTAGWFKRGFSLVAFNSEHGLENREGERAGHCLVEFRGDSNRGATEIAAAIGIAASQYSRSGKNTLHVFQFDLQESTLFISNRADRNSPDQMLGIATLAVEPKSIPIDE